MFAPLRVAIVGGHGAENRLSPNEGVMQLPVDLHPEVRRRLLEIATRTDGLLAEEKDHSIALHYRLVPEQEHAVRAQLEHLCAQWPAGEIEILPGKSVFEVKPTGFNKGTAIRALMQNPPFAGRRPIFIGDDVTDETAIAVMPEFEGFGYSVGRRLAGTSGFFATPREVRHWLYGLIQMAPERRQLEQVS